MKDAGYNYAYAGEDLATGFNSSYSVNNAWLNSPDHKANIMGSHYTNIGVAVVSGEYQGYYQTLVVAMFGSTQ